MDCKVLWYKWMWIFRALQFFASSCGFMVIRDKKRQVHPFLSRAWLVVICEPVAVVGSRTRKTGGQRWLLRDGPRLVSEKHAKERKRPKGPFGEGDENEEPR